MMIWSSPSTSYLGIKLTLSDQQFTIVKTHDRLLLISNVPQTN